VSPSDGFDLTFINAFFAIEVLFLLYYCGSFFFFFFFVGLQEGLLDLLRFVALLVPLGWTIPITPYLTALNNGHFFLCLCQESIGLCHLFYAFPFNLYFPTLIWLFKLSSSLLLLLLLVVVHL